VIPSILRSRIEWRWHMHAILGFCEEWRVIVETSAGIPLVGEWRYSETVARMDETNLARALREPALLVA
jgi:hypothetical protein